MSRQYDRKYELVITTPEGEQRTIRDLRVAFEITKSLLSYPNLCKLVIYNPNQDTRSALQKRFTKLVLNAGYGNNLGLIFKGSVRNSFESRTSIDRTITVFAGDGQRDWQNANFNKTFNKNITVKSVVEEVVNSFDEVTKGTLEGIPDVSNRLRGQTLSGSSKDILTDLANEFEFNWSIQDEKVITTSVDLPLSTNEAVLIKASTGMIGTPTLTEIGADVTTLLNPKLLPNKAFKIESESAEVQLGNLFFRNVNKTSAEGTYKIQEVIFKGDSRDGDWVSMCKGRRVNV